MSSDRFYCFSTSYQLPRCLVAVTSVLNGSSHGAQHCSARCPAVVSSVLSNPIIWLHLLLKNLFLYICNSQEYFIWLSMYYMKPAWEWATDKKNANCLESPYSSCFQITLYLSAKIVFFLWIPEFSGYNLHGDFKNNPNQEWHLYRSRVHVTHRQR